MLQKEKLLTSKDTIASALSATKFHINPTLFLAILMVQVSSHGTLSANQYLVKLEETLRT